MNYKQIISIVLVFFMSVQITMATAYAQKASSSAAQEPLQAANDYQLAYPGMLPDNPLYFLKVIRDNLAYFFISKPLSKASFYLLQSDKDVEASYLLVTREQGKTALAVTTFITAQDDFQKSLSLTNAAKKQGYTTQEMSKKLALANQKHLQMLQALEQQPGLKGNQALQKEQSRIGSFASMIKAVR